MRATGEYAKKSTSETRVVAKSLDMKKTRKYAATQGNSITRIDNTWACGVWGKQLFDVSATTVLVRVSVLMHNNHATFCRHLTVVKFAVIRHRPRPGTLPSEMEKQ